MEICKKIKNLFRRKELITEKEFEELFPRCKDPKDWVQAFNKVFPEYGITTDKRIAAFLAQCGYESGGWRVFSENLNYSEKALKELFSKYFLSPELYARQPCRIANVIYANRMGNGPPESCDGWNYRGRGPIQLTGKDNYTAFEKDMGVSVVENPDNILNSKEICLKSAIWFWNTHNLNKYADTENLPRMTRIINGGHHGLQERIELYDKVKNSLNKGTTKLFKTQRKGSRGETVKYIQRKLEIADDGIFGARTERALKEFQKKHGLVADGIVGQNTFAKMMEI